MDVQLARRPLARFLLALSLATAFATATQAQSLEARIDAILGSDQLKNASVGVHVVEIKAGGDSVDLYGHNASALLGPASNTKLLTTAAAFERYGSRATFKTVLYKVGEDLVVVGGGDPALGDAKLPGNEDITGPFKKWAAQLKEQGIVRFRDLIVDDRVFDDQWVHPNWPRDQYLSWYSAPVGGLNFNANCLDWRPRVLKSGAVGVELIPQTSYVSATVKAKRGSEMRVSMIRTAQSNNFEMRGTVSGSGASPTSDPYSVSIYDPGLWTGTIIRDTLADAGIRGTGTVRRVAPGEKLGSALRIAQHETSLLAAMRRCNKNSINMMAEAFCKRLGHDATGVSGSWKNGTAAVMAYMKSIGVPEKLVELDDGSGLSKENKVAARAITAVLAHAAARSDGHLFISTLAEPGEEGTLKRRFKDMPVAPYVHAKTGHIKGVSTLSGYIDLSDTPIKRRFAFSILCNRYVGNVNPLQDRICQAIYDWSRGK